jgi:hypothetical protein
MRIQLAAAVLARAGKQAVVVLRRPSRGEADRAGHPETAALLVLVLHQARVKQQVLLFPEPIGRTTLWSLPAG